MGKAYAATGIIRTAARRALLLCLAAALLCGSQAQAAPGTREPARRASAKAGSETGMVDKFTPPDGKGLPMVIFTGRLNNTYRYDFDSDGKADTLRLSTAAGKATLAIKTSRYGAASFDYSRVYENTYVVDKYSAVFLDLGDGTYCCAVYMPTGANGGMGVLDGQIYSLSKRTVLASYFPLYPFKGNFDGKGGYTIVSDKTANRQTFRLDADFRVPQGVTEIEFDKPGRLWVLKEKDAYRLVLGQYAYEASSHANGIGIACTKIALDKGKLWAVEQWFTPGFDWPEGVIAGQDSEMIATPDAVYARTYAR